MVDLNDFGIPGAPADDPWSNIVGKVLWTFRGRLRAITPAKPDTTTYYYYYYYYGNQKPERQPRLYLYSWTRCPCVVTG
jgi:hypothetical protein